MRTRGTVTLVFDDGYTEVYEQVLPLLRRHRMRAVFAVPLRTDEVERTEGLPVTPLAAWKAACQRDGHELAAHGVWHRPLTMLPDDELQRELRESQATTGATTLVYPGGAADERVRRAAARTFRAARTTQWGVEALPPRDMYALRTLNATEENFHWWKFWPRELQAFLGAGWVIETFHRVTARPVKPHDVSLHDFVWHLRWLSRLPLRVATIREAV